MIQAIDALTMSEVFLGSFERVKGLFLSTGLLYSSLRLIIDDFDKFLRVIENLQELTDLLYLPEEQVKGTLPLHV